MSASNLRQAGIEELAGIVGADHAREADPSEAIDGVKPRWVVEPGSVEEASEILKLANGLGLAVAVRGAGTKLQWGNPPSRLDLILSTRRLNRILEHAAGDLVVRAEAGTTLQTLQQELARAGQRLALDPPEEGATLGGILAANASGPLRYRYGTVRDMVIGITYVLPDGTVATAGGKVVKNVAGYDLSKLFTGSLGTLGLVAETIFRLHPVPAATRTVIVERVAGHTGLDACVQRIFRSTLVPSAVEFSWGDGGALAVLFEGIEPGVVAQAEAATEILQSYGAPQVLDTEGERQWWENWAVTAASLPEEGHPQAGTRVALKIAAVPHDLPAVLGYLCSSVLANRDDLGWRIRGHAGTGITYLNLGGANELLMEAIGEIREFITARGGSAVVRCAPMAIKQAIDVWGSVGDALPVMRRIKEQFDPNGIMSPGRFVGGL